MLFSRPLMIESTLTASVARTRVRTFAASSEMPDEAFRRRQIVGWRLSQSSEDFLFQPEYGDTLDVEGARFIGLVESVGSGSRIRGLIVASLLTKIAMGMCMLTIVFATVMALGQGTQPPAKVLGIALVTFGGTVLMVRYGLRSTSRLVEARLRQSLEASGPRAAA
jgi:hypothetical protein